MSNPVARFLSYILHPLLMPFYTVFLVMQLNTYIAYSISSQLQRNILSLVFLTTCALPVLTAIVLLQKGRIRSLEMESIEERRFPFFSASLFYLICYYLLTRMPVPRILGLIVLGATLSIFAAWVLSYRWKISIHMIGAGGVTGMLYGVSQVLNADLVDMILLSVMLAGLLGVARLKAGQHSQSQILVGFVLGFIFEWQLLTFHSL